MKTIWLVKSENVGVTDPYIQELSKLSANVECIQALTFKFINASILEEAIKNVDKLSGIIFTSLRSIEAVGPIFNTLPLNLYNEWQKKKVFAIGYRTATDVREKLKLEPLGEKSANGQQLSEVILQETVSFDKPLLFPCGNLKKDVIPQVLASNDRDFRALTCYETKEHPLLKLSVSKLKSKPDCIVFFSPSGVTFTIPILKDLKFDWIGVKAVALGSSTNDKLVEFKIPVHGICSEPTPSSLMNLLKSTLYP